MISHSTKDYFVLKGKIQDLIDNMSICLPKVSTDAMTHQVSVKEDVSKIDETQVSDEEEASDLGEEWMVFEINGTKNQRNVPTLSK